MAKAKKSVFFCQNCGHEESKWLGQCPMCKEWNSFVEECVTTSNTAAVKAAKDKILWFFCISRQNLHYRRESGILSLLQLCGGACNAFI